MPNSTFKTLLAGSFWGIVAKILDAIAKFVTIPLLVGFYGKADYGLIALAFSLNAYLRLMDVGMNTGSIRFFAIWISEKNWDKIEKVSRSSIVFYGWIGIINTLIFIFFANTAGSYFKLESSQQQVFQWIMYILAASTVFNWLSNVVNQLLNAFGEQSWINKSILLSSVLNFIVAIITIKLEFGLATYFVLYTLTTMIVIPLNIFRLRIYNIPLTNLLSPKWDRLAFKEVLNYSLAIFAMGIFQFSADNLRPILLAKYSTTGIEVMTEYRILQTIVTIIIAFGGIFMNVLLPAATKINNENNKRKIDLFIYSGTKYITFFLAFVVFIIITNAKTFLVIYMGSDYENLSNWLILWLLTVLVSMHNVPIASLVLSTGKTRFLVYSSAVSCLLSLPITGLLASYYGVGAAVIGYLVYIIIQIGCYYVYYIPKILKLNSYTLFFNSFLPCLFLGLFCWICTDFISDYITLQSNWFQLILNSIIFSVVFVIVGFGFLIKPSEIKHLLFNKSSN